MAHLGGAIRGYSNSEPNDKMSSRREFIQTEQSLSSAPGRNKSARFAVRDRNVRGGTFFKRPFHSCANVTKLYKINTPREVDRSASETATAYWQVRGAT